MPQHDPQQLTLRIDGPKVTAEQFADAVNAFVDLLDEVSRDVTGSAGAVRWIITLESGSNLVNATPEAIKKRARVAGLGRTISRGVGLVERRAQRPKHFTDWALRRSRDLSAVADGQDVRSIQIRAAETTNIMVSEKLAANVNRLLGEDIEEYGTVEGRLQTLSERNRPHFAVYDPLTDQPVRCNIQPAQLELAWKAFGRRVAVSGVIRYRKNGQPVSIQAESLYVFPADDQLPTAEDVYGILSTAQ
jgi:hypothetical protein